MICSRNFPNPNSRIRTRNTADSNQEPTTNNTNLAIKGIIGLQAMSEISLVLGKQADSTRYSVRHRCSASPRDVYLFSTKGFASSYYKSWQSLATSSDGQHLLANYGNDSSWALMYNLYADRLLQTRVVPDSVSSVGNGDTTILGFKPIPLGIRKPNAVLWRTFELRLW